MSTVTAPRLKERYKSEVTAQLQKEFNFSNKMQIPTLSKIVVNMGVGEAAKDSKLIEGAIRDLTTITGQRPLVTKARKSIANFKLREGQPIGAHVTLRGDRMWEFMDRLLSVSLPRIRDFRGYSLRSNKTRLIASVEWISPSLLQPRMTMKVVRFSRRSVFHLRIKGITNNGKDITQS